MTWKEWATACAWLSAFGATQGLAWAWLLQGDAVGFFAAANIVPLAWAVKPFLFGPCGVLA